MDKKIISIMAVWDEQNMISLSLQSTKDIVYQYVIIIKKGIDKTKEVIDYCVKLWNLNVMVIHSELKLRESRKLAVEKTKDYADYYLIQDGDEIYLDTEQLKKLNRKTIPDLINEGYIFCSTSMIFLEKTLKNTRKKDEKHNPPWWSTWLVPHPFLFKNTEHVFWPNIGDMPATREQGKKFNTGSFKNPYKFDCKIKNFRRIFLRDVFTPWHDSDFEGTIEEYADANHPDVIWYRQNVDKDLTLEEIIEKVRKNREDDMSNFIMYDEEKYYIYPSIIQKFINIGKIKGIETLDDLKIL